MLVLLVMHSLAQILALNMENAKLKLEIARYHFLFSLEIFFSTIAKTIIPIHSFSSATPSGLAMIAHTHDAPVIATAMVCVSTALAIVNKVSEASTVASEFVWTHVTIVVW
jgi:hypothetical protein